MTPQDSDQGSDKAAVQDTARGLDLAAETDLEALRQRLSETRRRRMDAQRRAAERPVVARAVELTLRDRSAQTSPEVDTLRSQAERLHEELLGSMLEVDHLRLLLHRVTTRGAHLLPGRAAQLQTVLEDEAAWRERLRITVGEQLDHPLHVPPPADLTGQHATEAAVLPTGVRTGIGDAAAPEVGG